MKRIILSFIIALPFSIKAQCSSGDCTKKLGDYTFIKSISIDASKAEGKANQFSYLFSKGNTYTIMCCDSEVKGSRMVVTLFDKDHNEIATNKKGRKFYPSLTLPCTATGVYYIESYYESSKEACGYNVIGFKKS